MNLLHKPPFAGNVRNASCYVIDYTGASVLLANQLSSQESGTWNSVKTAGFRTYQHRRDLPWNNFSATRSYTQYSSGSYGGIHSYYGTWTGYRGFCYEQLTGSSFPFYNPSAAATEYAARAKILNRLKDSSINLAQSFVERKQTVSLISKNVNRIASAALAIRRGNLRHASNLFGLRYSGRDLRKEIRPSRDNLANYWLEYSYGWRPLLSDIYGASELLAKTFLDNRPTRVQATHRDSYQQDRYLVYQLGGYLPGSNEYAYSDVLVESKYIIEFVEDNQFAARMASTGITDPLLLSWELLPYSFVVDWFLPIGSYLGQLSATRGLVFKRGILSQRRTENHSTVWVRVAKGKNNVYVDGLSRRYDLDRKTRTVLSSFPSPPPLVYPGSFGISKALSGLALINQLFKR